jgi:cysteine-rich repeat protein
VREGLELGAPGYEACDDANELDTDACLSSCQEASCGDGLVHEGVEACDDGNQINTDACLENCVAASCGDGHVQAGQEACDDGNVQDDDGCSGVCQTEGNQHDELCGQHLHVAPEQVRAGWTLCYIRGNDPNWLRSAACSATFPSAGKTYGCWHGRSTFPHQNNNQMLENACRGGVQNGTRYNSWGGTDHILTICIQH